MQDLIASGAAWFDQQRKKHLAVTVGYKPAGEMFERKFPATIGLSRFESIDANNQIVRMETRDYFVSVDDYEPNPKKGDHVIEEINGIRRTFMVSGPGGTSNAWSWADRGQTIRRIHTQLVEEF